MLRTAHPDRPPIWAEGRQSPPFDLRAFLRASLDNARAVSVRSLDAGAIRAAAALPRLPRLAAGTQALCASAAGSLREPEAEDDADTRVITAVLASAFPRPAVAEPAVAPRPPTETDPTLAAIRAVLRDQAVAAERPAAPVGPAPDALAQPLRRSSAPRLVAALAVILLLPFGAASALYAHLSGEDLRLSG